MYQRKLNAQESLQEILLRMKYDSKKTLSENVEISEQNRGTGAYALAPKDMTAAVTSAPKVISPIANQSSQPFLVDCTKVAGVPMTNVTVTPEQQKAFQDATGLNPNTPENQIFFCDITKMNKKIVELTVNSAKNVTALAQKVFDPNNKNPQNPPAGVTNPTPPSDLKDVKHFQQWLDDNKGEWAWSPRQQKYYKVEQNPKRGYGRFGPSTQKMWNDPKIKDEYLKSLQGTDKTAQEDIETATNSVTGESPDDILKNY